MLLFLLMLVGGIGIFIFGVHRFVAGPDKEVTCSGRVMQPGDLCHHYRNGSLTDTKTYDQEKSDQGSIGTPIAAVIIGPLMAVGGGAGVRALATRRWDP